MLVQNQKVIIKWNGKHRKYYESIIDSEGNQKYIWAGNGVEFEVDVEDLPHGSQAIVKVKCDYCEKNMDKHYVNYIRENENNNSNGIYKDCCRECLSIKMREIHGTLDEIEIIDNNEVNQSDKYSEDFLISEFFRYEKEFGVYPKKTDVDGTNGYPSASSYNIRWGSWEKFLLEIGVLGEYGWYKKDEDTLKEMYPNENYSVKDINEKLIIKRSIYELQKMANKLGLIKRSLFTRRVYDKSLDSLDLFYLSLRDLAGDIDKCPTVMDYDEYTKINKLPSRRKAEKQLGKSFSQICKELFQETNKEIKTNEELLNDLRELKYKLGRTPKANELKVYGLAEKKTYMRRFNMTYQELIESLGWELPSPKLRFKSEEEMLADYEKLYCELGRLPNNFDLQNCEYTASYQTYRDKFGSLMNVWHLLELPYDVNQDISAGFVYLNKRNEICRSNVELQISNILINSKINYVSEMKYSDLDNSLNKKWKMDWYLSDNDIYVEYFGMYKETHLKRNTRIGKYSRKVKKKIEYCKKNNIRLIDLYKGDLDNNLQGLCRKFLENGISLNII